MTLDRIGTMTSKTYCVSWDRVYQNSLDIDTQLSNAGLDYLMYNDSSHSDLNDRWVRADRVWYLGHFYNAIKDFLNTDHSVFIFNAGDGVFKDYSGLTKKVETLFESDPDCWAYAPCFSDADVWSWDGSSIGRSTQHAGLVLSTHTNGIWVATSRKLAEVIFDFYEWMFENGHLDREFEKVNLGWGIDSVYCALTISLNKKVYRDWGCVVGHESVTDYDHGKAMVEMRMIVQQSLGYAEHIGLDPNKMGDLLNLMYRKVVTKEPLIVSQVYLNLDDDEGFVF